MAFRNGIDWSSPAMHDARFPVYEDSWQREIACILCVRLWLLIIILITADDVEETNFIFQFNPVWPLNRGCN